MQEEILNFENEDILRTIPEGKSGVCLYSGGKDCGLALSMALEKSNIAALINCCEQEHPMFHQHDKDLMSLQSQALKIPIIYSNGHWKNSANIKEILKKFKQQGVEYILFGDICSTKNANRKLKLCEDISLIPCMPLWNLSYDNIYDEMKKRNLICLLSSVRPKIKEYLGKIFDDEIYETFKKIGISPLGENGEFHSTLLNLDVFEFQIKYNIKSIHKRSDKFGDKWEVLVDYYK